MKNLSETSIVISLLNDDSDDDELREVGELPFDEGIDDRTVSTLVTREETETRNLKN